VDGEAVREREWEDEGEKKVKDAYERDERD
jgi:hypothetical protein